MEMDAAYAHTTITGVMEILEDEMVEPGHEKIRVCIAALDQVARWLDVVAEADEIVFE